MNILIIEDEKAAARHITALIRQHAPEAEIVAQLDSVKHSVEWWQNNSAPDLVFMDIQLADGLSFEIFEHVQITVPVIFTTAYDQYAIQAFKVNSIDYLLKPIDEEELEAALDKYRSYHQKQVETTTSAVPGLTQLQQALQMLQSPGYKNRFVVKIGERIKAIPSEKILYFFSQAKVTYLQTVEGKHYIIDYSLDQVEQMVDPAQFFRISRKYIVGLSAIDDIITYSSSRLKLHLRHSNDSDVLVSRDRVSAFRTWLDQ
ncbi:LytR/AlgR family response regulator transcription factor [Tunicatimonas pelagia]|uniref:LytR/AlgR family response regulator transcription factor n=1 Tax=Tunicatimonas pelagia TaxID=931531 RepID=UPI002665982D|nr:LytTR family DNA-binding domain-containing protein [Tunicatimonas pelagia]WKN41254.1 LytTR family DNA-binding domain-containing protein [Tunicatimonas pelagia]